MTKLDKYILYHYTYAALYGVHLRVATVQAKTSRPPPLYWAKILYFHYPL